MQTCCPKRGISSEIPGEIESGKGPPRITDNSNSEYPHVEGCGWLLCLLGVKSGLWWKAGIGGPSISRIAESVYQDKNQVRGGGGEALPSKPNS